MGDSLFPSVGCCLAACHPAEKLNLVAAARAAWRADRLTLDSVAGPEPIGEPGRPAKPRLVHPRQVPRRGIHTPQGRAALIHAIAHIEFNAINLALDAAYRFRNMPRDYYDDWLRVASEEADHFGLLTARLAELGHAYGDFDAHNGLWEMARKTAHDPLVRMALVPRVLEARGLDVTPGMMARLERIDDEKTVAILRIILHEEIGHVAIGSRWFKYLCERRNLEPESTFRALLADYGTIPLPGPCNIQARLEAGFSETELARLQRE